MKPRITTLHEKPKPVPPQPRTVLENGRKREVVGRSFYSDGPRSNTWYLCGGHKKFRYSVKTTANREVFHYLFPTRFDAIDFLNAVLLDRTDGKLITMLKPPMFKAGDQ